jgi:tetratricopeptide (TPR) repeat protein
MAKKSPLDIEQTSDTWFLVVRQLRIWLGAEDETPFRPYVTLAVNMNTGAIHGTQLGEEPSAKELEKQLFQFMTKPDKNLHILPQRPARLFLERQDLAKALSPALMEIGVQVKYRSQTGEIDEIIHNLEDHLRGDAPDVPGLLSQKGVSLQMVASLFAAAAAFYRAAPWVELSNSDLLALKVSQQKEPWFVTVMGQGGMEYGLALYKDWDSVLLQYGPRDHSREAIPPAGMHAFFFNQITEVSFDDLDALERYKWELADPQAYPVPMIFTQRGEVRRPGKDDLLWYEAALRAIPVFVSQHLSHDPDGRLLPVETEIPVSTAAGKMKVHIRYPGGELPDAPLMDDLPELFDEDDEDDESIDAPFDLRLMEKELAQLSMFSDERAVSSQVQRAQKMIYDAWEESNPARRLALARKALKISPDCADAYVLLAEEQATDVRQALEFYQQGAAAGKRALGEACFKENAGHFWGLLETRPYMRCLGGMAGCLIGIKRELEALEIYREMLRLNPGDNQGVRYHLVDLLLGLNRADELETLLHQYKGDYSTVWTYTTALVQYRKNGASPAADKALRAALEQNSFAPVYLLGKKRLPNQPPSSILAGGDSEAVNYAGSHLNHWRRAPGALDWLERLAARTRQKPARPKKQKHLFRLGQSVRVKSGVKDPDNGADISGWQGLVKELSESDEGPLVLIGWDSRTLQEIPEEYIRDSAENELEWSEIYLLEDEVEPASERVTPEETQETLEQLKERYFWAFLGEQGLRIQAVVQGLDPEDEPALFHAWETHLRQKLELPFKAEVIEPVKGIRLKMEEHVTVTGVTGFDEENGVLVEVEKGRLKTTFPLFNLENIGDADQNDNLIDDYSTWYFERM